LEFSGVNGVDAVIITAVTKNLDPIDLAGRLCRNKGKVIVVGAVPTGFSRENYYKKELELRMSCSYGPGRYDVNYEEKGVDYPIGYIRWTENRNMQAFLQMAADGKLNIELITTHIFDFENAKKTYQMIADKSESYVGILLKYDVEKEVKPIVKLRENIKYEKGVPNIGFIGAGSFAQKFLLPNAKKYGNLIGVATAAGNETRNIADKYGFNYASGNADDIIKDESINTVFIATRHNLHCEYVLKGLKAGKNVFVEKPLCMNESELKKILEVYSTHYALCPMHLLMVGFNRRFSPLISRVKSLFAQSSMPYAINYRINAGFIPKDNWIQDKDIGGGRIIGEVCHFIDLAMFIAGARITDISANAMNDAGNLMDTLLINLRFENGSIATVSYFSNGSNALNKEYLEVYSAGQTVIIDDFKEMRIYGKKVKRTRLLNQNKGHAKEVELFLKSIKEGKPAPIPFKDVHLSTLATFKVIESIKTGQTVNLSKITKGKSIPDLSIKR